MKNLNSRARTMLFTVINKKTPEMKSTCLTASMVYFLFIDKMWDKNNCVIHDKVGNEMDYETFKNRYPL